MQKRTIRGPLDRQRLGRDNRNIRNGETKPETRHLKSRWGIIIIRTYYPLVVETSGRTSLITRIQAPVGRDAGVEVLLVEDVHLRKQEALANPNPQKG
jgi:hypothetical protein